MWQRDYFERVIRDEREIELVRAYIQDNPTRWGERSRAGTPPWLEVIDT